MNATKQCLEDLVTESLVYCSFLGFTVTIRSSGMGALSNVTLFHGNGHDQVSLSRTSRFVVI